MIFDAHMHVGDFGPMMNVGIDAAGLAELMRAHHIDGGVVLGFKGSSQRRLVGGTVGGR
jgi:hypothetical protein